MRKLSVLIIHDPGAKDSRGNEKRDGAVDQVAAALTAKGHKTELFAIPNRVEAFVQGIQERRPEIVFNMGEGFGDNIYHDYNVAAVLEVMGVPFTGATAGGLFLSQDKVLTKKLLAFHGVGYPPFILLAPNHIETAGRVRFPLFVKPARADASLGIHASSLVQNFKSLIERVEYVHEVFGVEALCEQYIDGREYYLSVLGHLNPQVLSVVELDFSGLPRGAVPVASYEAKWNRRTRAYKGTKAVVAPELTPDMLARLKEVAREAYLALRLRDYGRVDMRVTPGGEVFVIEVNPNPYLAKDSEFVLAAQQSGIVYEDLIERIIEMAWKRRRERIPGLTEVLAGEAATTGRVSANTPLPAERPARVAPAPEPADVSAEPPVEPEKKAKP